ncbi:MAG: hypothetical protein ACXWMO_12745 [Syntrophales bacterium]
MMKTLLVVVIGGILVYLLLKLCLCLYRPLFLSKTFREIEQMYNRLLDALERDVGTWVETWEEWQYGDKVVRTQCRENDIMEHINAAKAAKAHEEEVYGKFLRLRERFILNPKKLADSIVAYRRYLQVALQHYQDAMLCASAVTSGAFSFDEMMAARKEIMIIMEENERKLDILLTE